jgi:hypothetical protein
MSSLQRYRKPGGFVQLLSLIETFGPAKREKFLEMIEDESGAWATALREKMLTLDRVVQWSDDAVVKVLRTLPIKSQAYAIEAFTPELKARVHAALSHGENRKIADVLSENKPKPDEIASVGAKYLETARRMLMDRDLSAERVDARLVIPDGIEVKLDWSGANAVLSPTPVPVHVEVDRQAALTNNDVTKMRADLKNALRENQALREEVLKLREKLDLVRRAAA